LDINRGLAQVLADGDNEYLYGLTRIGEEQLLVWLYHLPDAIHSVRVLSTESANIQAVSSYEPFGSDFSTSGTGSSAYRFAGEVKDVSGLYQLRARYLDTRVGRFTQADPSRLESNPFSYAKNNPATFVDPTGLVSVEIWSAAFIERDVIVLPHFESLIPPVGWAFARFRGDNRSYYRGQTPSNCRMHNPSPSSRLCHNVVLEFSRDRVEKVTNTSGTGRSHLTFFDIGTLQTKTIEETAAKPESASVVTFGCITTVTLKANAGVPTEPEFLQSLGPIVYEYMIRFDRCLGKIDVNGIHTQYPWQELWVSGTAPIEQDKPPLESGLAGAGLLVAGRFVSSLDYVDVSGRYEPLVGLNLSDPATPSPFVNSLPSSHLDLLYLAACLGR
jgi:RHS repeat-associated protein